MKKIDIENHTQAFCSLVQQKITDGIKFVESLPMFMRHRVVDESCRINCMRSKACPDSQLIQILFFKVITQGFCILHTITIQIIQITFLS